MNSRLKLKLWRHRRRHRYFVATTPSGNGFWVVDSWGDVRAYGDAVFYGGLAYTRLNAWISGIAATASGQGYWLVARDGGVFTFGDAQFFGSLGALGKNYGQLSIQPTATGHGYNLIDREKNTQCPFGDADSVLGLFNTESATQGWDLAHQPYWTPITWAETGF